MRRADRLFEIIQVLRRSKRPLTAADIAEQLESSRRTIYRDIAALMNRDVPIRGEAGVGYVLDGGFDMPPLMLTPEEMEAVVLGSHWVVENADPTLAGAAVDVLAKLSAIVPKRLRSIIDDPVVGTPPNRHQRNDSAIDMARLREWCRREQKVVIRYADEGGKKSERTVWPILIGYVSATRVLVGWCELRRDFRLFRTERLRDVRFLDARYPQSRASLRGRWRAALELNRR